MKKAIVFLIALAFTISAQSQEVYHVISQQCKIDTLYPPSNADYYVIRKADGRYWQKHKTKKRSFVINITSNNELECYFLLVFGGLSCKMNYINENINEKINK